METHSCNLSKVIHMTNKEKTYQKYGVLGALGFAVATGVLLLTLGFTTPLPLPAEEGILINFGDSESGFGETEPQENNFEQPEETQEAVEESNTENQTEEVTPAPDEEIMTQEFEEAPAEETANETPAPTTKEETKKEEKKEEEKKEQEVNKKALFPGKSQNESNTSEGEAGGEGNQGSKTGSTESENHSGGSSTGGDGVDFSLAGRNPESLPKPAYNYQEEGKVVVDITVDKLGRVTKANAGVKGSTTLDKNLLDAAKKAALRAKFDKKPDAPAYQNGTITYYFKLK